MKNLRQMHRNSKIIEVSERLLSTAEVARALQVSRNSVTGWISRGQITAIQLPSGQFRIPESEVTKVLEPLETLEHREATPVSDSLQRVG